MQNPERDEFFVGYDPPVPPRLARFVGRVVTGAGALALALAGVLAAGHVPLDGGTFEFGRPRPFSGTVVERPYPVVRLDATEGTNAGASRAVLLVAPGKHGADAVVGGLSGRHVTFTGTRVHRGAWEAIEIDPSSLVTGQAAAVAPVGAESPGRSTGSLVELTGEIVDSKCFLGVMVPGAGKTHKDCASLCLRGGIPPAFHVQDRDGRSALLLVTHPSGEPMRGPAVQMAGEALSVTGSVDRHEGWLVLRTDPESWHPVEQ